MKRALGTVTRHEDSQVGAELQQTTSIYGQRQD